MERNCNNANELPLQPAFFAGELPLQTTLYHRYSLLSSQASNTINALTSRIISSSLYFSSVATARAVFF